MSFSPAATICVLLNLIAAVRLGAAVYETSVLDPAWPSKPCLVQPDQGGVDRKRFWIKINSLFELGLAFGFALCWPVKGIPLRLFAAAVPYLIMRGWSFAYFIPVAHRFERGAIGGAAFRRAALRWTSLSRFRVLLDAAALFGCAAAMSAALRIG